MNVIAENEFVPLVRAAVPRLSVRPPNMQQQQCVLHDPTVPLMIAAGPGSGKTTVLVLRALRLIFCNGLLPEQIVITTFTRKAAQELRARLIEWGLLLKDEITCRPSFKTDVVRMKWLDNIDINRFITGTLDSICEEMLTTHRDPLDPGPVLVEGFVGDALLVREGIFASGAFSNPGLRPYLGLFTFEKEPPRNFAELIGVTRTLMDRLIYDQVDMAAYSAGISYTDGRKAIADALSKYRAFMDGGNRMDFARLEELFLEKLRQMRLPRLISTLKALLVDEYQDTNPLQESIYFELVRQTKASFTVVGDDDQSLYRFRGATVELFRDFRARFASLNPAVPPPRLEYLIDNYRSTPEIVAYFNDFIRNDPAFAPARVQPLKPLIKAQLPSNGMPILGMFRTDVQTLADHLSAFLMDVFRGKGRSIAVNGKTVEIIGDPQGGNLGDAVILAHTVNEYGARWGNQPPKERLPKLMRDRLAQVGVSIFNPRGRELRDIPFVQQLLGIILDCIDRPDAASPDGIQQTLLASPPAPGTPKLRNEAQLYLRQWRAAARAFAATNPAPNKPHTLNQFICAWQNRKTQTGEPWPEEWPILELCFKVLSWIPFLRDDPEGQIYLEAITRCIAQAATYSSYRSQIVGGTSVHAVNSIQRAIRDLFAPLAEGEVDVDEEIMPNVPRERLPFMTVHQAKGLEYPLVIVDVSSDYQKDAPKNRFRRFPEEPSNVHCMEDDLASYCSIGPLRSARDSLARTFDDLIRLYYVAYSRPQSALMLVGLDRCLQYKTSIKHVAIGWRADQSWTWCSPVAGTGKKGNKMPALANNIPLVLV